MIGIIEYSLAREISADVYQGSSSRPPGWVLDTSFGNNGEFALDNGFYAYALKKVFDDGTRILAFRGTEGSDNGIPDLRDWYTDFNSVGRDQFNGANEVVNNWLERGAKGAKGAKAGSKRSKEQSRAKNRAKQSKGAEQRQSKGVRS
jgi:hypothetical protein